MSIFPNEIWKEIIKYIPNENNNWFHCTLVSKDLCKLFRKYIDPSYDFNIAINKMLENKNILASYYLLQDEQVRKKFGSNNDILELFSLLEYHYIEGISNVSKKELKAIYGICKLLADNFIKRNEYEDEKDKIDLYDRRNLINIVCIYDFHDILNQLLKVDKDKLLKYRKTICDEKRVCFPLQYACENNSIECVKIILNTIKLCHTNHLIYILVSKGYLDVIKLLMQYSDINFTLLKDYFYIAMEEKNYVIAEYFLTFREFNKYQNNSILNWCIETENCNLLKSIVNLFNDKINESKILTIIKSLRDIPICRIYWILKNEIIMNYFNENQIEMILNSKLNIKNHFENYSLIYMSLYFKPKIVLYSYSELFQPLLRKFIKNVPNKVDTITWCKDNKKDYEYSPDIEWISELCKYRGTFNVLTIFDKCIISLSETDINKIHSLLIINTNPKNLIKSIIDTILIDIEFLNSIQKDKQYNYLVDEIPLLLKINPLEHCCDFFVFKKNSDNVWKPYSLYL